MICKSCGSQLPEGSAFCTTCGTPVTAPVVPPVYMLPEQNRPLSPWAYWGLQLLYAVPIVGFIFLIIHSCSGANINRRNFARSYWCSLLLVAIIFLIMAVTGALGSAMYYYY